TAILLDVETVRFLADLRADGVADGPRRFDIRRSVAPLIPILQTQVGDETRHLFGYRFTLQFVGVKNPRWCPALEGSGELPGQVGGICDAGIHAVARVRDPDMRRIPANESAAIAETIRDQTPADPIFPRDDIVL